MLIPVHFVALQPPCLLQVLTLEKARTKNHKEPLSAHSHTPCDINTAIAAPLRSEIARNSTVLSSLERTVERNEALKVPQIASVHQFQIHHSLDSILKARGECGRSAKTPELAFASCF